MAWQYCNLDVDDNGLGALDDNLAYKAELGMWISRYENNRTGLWQHIFDNLLPFRTATTHFLGLGGPIYAIYQSGEPEHTCTMARNSQVLEELRWGTVFPLTLRRCFTTTYP